MRWGCTEAKSLDLGETRRALQGPYAILRAPGLRIRCNEGVGWAVGPAYLWEGVELFTLRYGGFPARGLKWVPQVVENGAGQNSGLRPIQALQWVLQHGKYPFS